jgi:DNA polymerase-3 subunit delta
MRISTEDLPQHLSRGLGSLYVIHGEALLLAIETADAIRTAAREAGYSERETLIAEQGFKWAELRTARRACRCSPRAR